MASLVQQSANYTFRWMASRFSKIKTKLPLLPLVVGCINRISPAFSEEFLVVLGDILTVFIKTFSFSLLIDMKPD